MIDIPDLMCVVAGVKVRDVPNLLNGVAGVKVIDVPDLLCGVAGVKMVAGVALGTVATAMTLGVAVVALPVMGGFEITKRIGHRISARGASKYKRLLRTLWKQCQACTGGSAATDVSVL